jgi:hypothetical protein
MVSLHPDETVVFTAEADLSPDVPTRPCFSADQQARVLGERPSCHRAQKPYADPAEFLRDLSFKAFSRAFTFLYTPAGKVKVAGHPRPKAGLGVAPDAELEVLPEATPFVSRGGLKLRAANRRITKQEQFQFALAVFEQPGFVR